MNKSVEVQDLGNKDYKQTWDYQEQLFKGIVDAKIKIVINHHNSNVQ